MMWGRQTTGRGCPGNYGKPYQEFPPRLGLVTGNGEGGDGQVREGILKEVMLEQDELEELGSDESKGSYI